MIEDQLTKLTAAVERLPVVLLETSQPVRELPPGYIPPEPQPQHPATEKQYIDAIPPHPPTPQPVATPSVAVDTKGITADAIKVKASDLARRLGPRAATISQKLSELGTARLSELAQEHYVTFDSWLNTTLAAESAGAK